MSSGASNFFFGSGMGNPFFFAVDDKKPDKPKQASYSDEEVQAAAAREAALLRARRSGARGTILTGPAGVEEESKTYKTTLG